MKNCTNCESQNSMDSIYCKICGQSLNEELTMRVLFKETIANYFSFDSSLKRSIGPLLFKPGKIAKDFSSGKRTKYIHPAKLYLFTSFIFFIVLGISAWIEDAPDSTFTVKGPNPYPTEYVMDSIKANTITTDSIPVSNKNQLETSSNNIEFDYASDNPFWFKLQQNLENKKINLVSETLTNLPYALIISVPIFSFFLMLLLYKQPQKYSGHLVHALYYFSITFLVWSLFVAIDTFNYSSLEILNYLPVLPIVFLWFYLTKSIQIFYCLSWGKSILISSLQSIIYMFFIVPILSIILALIAILFA